MEPYLPDCRRLQVTAAVRRSGLSPATARLEGRAVAWPSITQHLFICTRAAEGGDACVYEYPGAGTRVHTHCVLRQTRRLVSFACLRWHQSVSEVPFHEMRVSHA